MKARQQVERREKVADAVHSGRLEGRDPSPQFLADAKKYADGKIEAEEVVERTRKRYGLA